MRQRQCGEGVLGYALLTLVMVTAILAVVQRAEPRIKAHFQRVATTIAQPFP